MNKEQKEKIVLTKAEAQFAEKLLKDNAQQIRAVVCSTLGEENRYLAEDTVNEVCLLICQKIHTLEAHTCPKAWIIVAARNTAQNIKRKHKYDSMAIPFDEIKTKTGHDEVFEDAIYNLWLENKVSEKIIAKLTPREKEIYQKIYIEDKTPKEIAQELDISASSVRNIHKNLKDKINDHIKRKDF